VVVVLALVQLEDGGATLEVVARDQACGLELGEHAIHGRQPDVLVRLEQASVDVLRAEWRGWLDARMSRILSRGTVIFRPARRKCEGSTIVLSCSFRATGAVRSMIRGHYVRREPATPDT